MDDCTAIVMDYWVFLCRENKQEKRNEQSAVITVYNQADNSPGTLKGELQYSKNTSML